MLDRSITAEEIAALEPWFQRVVFPGGQRVGKWDTCGMIERLARGVELAGKTALDVGCMAGVGSLWMECQGARVASCEIDPRALKQYALVKLAFGMRAECQDRSVYDLGAEDAADVVLASGLYYHLRHPLQGLEKLWAVTGEVLLVEGEVLAGEVGSWAWYCPGEYKGDGSNWWIPTRQCLLDWLEGLDGEKRVVDVTPEGYLRSRMMVQVWRA